MLAEREDKDSSLFRWMSDFHKVLELFGLTWLVIFCSFVGFQLKLIFFHLPGKTRTKDKYRVVYTDHQRLELEKEFHYTRYITIRRKSELAQNLALSERQVKIWVSLQPIDVSQHKLTTFLHSTVPKPTRQRPKTKEEDGLRRAHERTAVYAVFEFIEFLGREAQDRSVPPPAPSTAAPANERDGLKNTIGQLQFSLKCCLWIRQLTLIHFEVLFDLLNLNYSNHSENALKPWN